jgi:hypothetical protein
MTTVPSRLECAATRAPAPAQGRACAERFHPPPGSLAPPIPRRVLAARGKLLPGADIPDRSPCRADRGVLDRADRQPAGCRGLRREAKAGARSQTAEQADNNYAEALLL